MNIRNKMSVFHEADVARILGGGVNRGSGNQWRAQMDGRTSRMHKAFAFAWDCKATLAKSMSISRSMWSKAVEQAQGERPALPLRFYDDESLKTYEDLVVLRFEDFAELLAKGNERLPLIVMATTKPLGKTIIIRDGKVSLEESHIAFGVEAGWDNECVEAVPHRSHHPVSIKGNRKVYDLRIGDRRVDEEAVLIVDSTYVYYLPPYPITEFRLEMI